MVIHFNQIDEKEFTHIMREHLSAKEISRLNSLPGDRRIYALCAHIRTFAQQGYVSYNYYNAADGLVSAYVSNRWNGELCMALRDMKFVRLLKYIHLINQHINVIGDVSPWCIKHQKSLTGIGEN